MKTKSVIMLLAASLLSMGVAQAQKTSKSDETVEFKPHVNLQILGGAGYTIGEVQYMQLFSPSHWHL